KLIKENTEIKWEDLNGFRFITGDNVRLHVSPSLNSEVIECIGKNTIVAILDKKDRQWLYVQVKSGDEFITGWITRTYTSLLRLEFYLRIFGLGVDDDVLLEALELF
ncbi:SH3 domain-containing protein, partial [Escherichia coli]|nr:SH3 domain-containing protein [Escherichia coli]